MVAHGQRGLCSCAAAGTRCGSSCHDALEPMQRWAGAGEPASEQLDARCHACMHGMPFGVQGMPENARPQTASVSLACSSGTSAMPRARDVRACMYNSSGCHLGPLVVQFVTCQQHACMWRTCKVYPPFMNDEQLATAHHTVQCNAVQQRSESAKGYIMHACMHAWTHKGACGLRRGERGCVRACVERGGGVWPLRLTDSAHATPLHSWAGQPSTQPLYT